MQNPLAPNAAQTTIDTAVRGDGEMVTKLWYPDTADERGTNERGATLVEHTIAFPLFFLLVFASIELLLFSYQVLTVQFVAARVVRQAALGPEVYAAGDYDSRESYLIQRLIHDAAMFQVKLLPTDIELCAAPSRGELLVSCRAADADGRFPNASAAGEPGQLVAIRTTVQRKFAWVGSLNVVNVAIGRNESWNS